MIMAYKEASHEQSKIMLKLGFYKLLSVRQYPLAQWVEIEVNRMI